MHRLKEYSLDTLFICMGACMGALLRHIITVSPNYSFKNFSYSIHPWNILFINVLASWVVAYLAKNLLTKHLKLMLIIGFCGSFSTFSTYSNDIINIWKSGKHITSIIYLVLSNLLSFAGILHFS